MSRLVPLVPLCLLASCGLRTSVTVADESELRAAVASPQTGAIELPPHEILLTAPLSLPSRPFAIRGTRGSVLRTASDFDAIQAANPRGLLLERFEIHGARTPHHARRGLPPYNVPFARDFRRNGIVVEGGRELTVRDVTLRNITDFAILVSRTGIVRIEGVTIEDSGSLDDRGINNTSGGILLEEGVKGFKVLHCSLRRVRGNAIWTHSNANAPRNEDGRFAHNRIEETARDALQVGHATRVTVEFNEGRRLGYPIPEVEPTGFAVGVDTAGNVDQSLYRSNRFVDVNGNCINLDGFHHGEVRGNSCQSTGPLQNYPYLHYAIVFGNADPGMQSERVTVEGNTVIGAGYGGVYLIGTHHTIRNNTLRMLNRAHCTGAPTPARCNNALNEPGMLRSGIYFARAANRPSPNAVNTVEGNTLSGFGMDRWCLAAAPGVSLQEQTVRANTCKAE
ncbi:MAG: right-handed parallel beta-helix repeat-containing protein [Bryobacteraceae bacterium]|nr:right-handed parallel beta-helix repeat-containing protein [Bryobacteraceae bacterium]